MTRAEGTRSGPETGERTEAEVDAGDAEEDEAGVS